MRFETQTNLYGDAPLLQKLTSHDTQFSVVQGKISAMITESELAELVSGGKTMYSAMNSIAIDVNGVHADMSRMDTVIGANSGQIETLNSQMATYSATVNGIYAEINATKIAHGGAETLQSCFEASATEILQSVSRTYATQTDVEDLLVDTVYQFNKNTSASVPPAESDSGWSTTSPAREEGKYIWMRAERTFKNGEITPTTPVCITGADGRDGIDGQDGRDGQDGAPGQQGPAGQPGAAGAPGVDGKDGRDGVDGKDGKDGKDGASISDVVPQYYLSTSNTTITGGTWGTAIPSYVSGRYYWTRELVTRTDSTTFYTDPRLDAQLNNFESRLYTAEQKITDSAIVQTVTSSNAWGQVVTKGSVILAINEESSEYTIDVDRINLNGIGGWYVTKGKIYGGDSETGVAVMQKPGGTSGNATWVFAAGGSSHSDYGDCKFRVSKNGDLYAIGNGRISGWSFTQSKIYGGDANTGVAVMQIPTSSTTWVFAAGGNTHDTYGSCPFRVNKSGKLYAKGAELSGDTSITGRLLQSAYGFTAEFGQALLTFSDQNATVYGEIGGMSLTGGKGLVIKGGEAGKNFVGIAASKIRVFVNEGSTVDPTGYYDTISVSFRVITSVSWTGSGIGYTYRVLDFQRGLLVGSHA